MKKVVSILLALVMVFALAACGNSNATSSTAASAPGQQESASVTPADKNVTLKMHHAGTDGDAYYQGAEKFAELANQYSDGTITIEIYPNSELASSANAVQGVQMGTIDIALESSMTEANFVDEMNVLNLPFLFTNYDKVWAVLDGEVGEILSQAAENAGFKLLYFWDNGFRNMSNNVRPVNSVADLSGLKIRVPENEVYIATWEALGAIPTPMAWSEVFSSLQLGTINGQENPNGHMKSYNLTEVQDYFAITNHVYTAEPLIINLDTFNSLSEKQQNALLKAAQEAGDFERELRQQINEETIEYIREAGVEVTTPDLAEFQSAVQPVYSKYADKYGDLLAKIQEITAE